MPDMVRRYLARLRESELSKSDVVAARQLLEKDDVTILPPVDGSMDDNKIASVLDKFQQSETYKIIAFLRQIELEWDTGREDFNSIIVEQNAIARDSTGKSERQQRVRVCYLKKPVFADGVPLLLLDGTGSVRLNRILFGSNLQHKEYTVERDAEVVQIDHPKRGFSSRSLTGRRPDGTPLSDKAIADAKALQTELASFIEKLSCSPVLVVGDKKAIEALQPQLPEKVKTAHFGNLRGMNTFESCEACVSIGRLLPPLETVEAIARAYAAGAAEPFLSILDKDYPYVPATIGMRQRNGTVRPVKIDLHPHPIAQEVLEQHREAEIVQGVDRIRPIHNRRVIYLFNKLVPDITVDRLVRWDELFHKPSRFEQAAIRSGVLPFSPAEMHRVFPDLWRTEKIAEHDVHKTPKHYRYLIRELGFCAVQYRRLNCNGKYYKAWVKGADPRAELERVVGIVKDFIISPSH